MCCRRRINRRKLSDENGFEKKSYDFKNEKSAEYSDNVLYPFDSRVRILFPLSVADFGFAVCMKGKKTMSKYLGSRFFMAPEVVKQIQYGFSVDWWALGILTYELLYGQTPFSDNGIASMFNAICIKKHTYPYIISNEVTSFIDMLLRKNANERPTYDEIIRHPFFTGINFEDILQRKFIPSFIPNILDISKGAKSLDFEWKTGVNEGKYFADFSDYCEY